jgi:hypothetical protein
LKTIARRIYDFRVFTAPVAVNSGKNHTAAGVPLFLESEAVPKPTGFWNKLKH